MTTTIRGDQAKAMGGCAPCQPASPIASSGSDSPGDKPAARSVTVLDPEKPGWIGITLVDTKKRPVANAAFIVTPPNHEPVQGNLDAFGRARIEGIEPGNCRVEFPELHKKDFV